MKIYTPTKLIKVTRNKKMTIPKEICQRLDIEEGDTLKLKVISDMIIITKIRSGEMDEK